MDPKVIAIAPVLFAFLAIFIGSVFVIGYAIYIKYCEYKDRKRKLPLPFANE